MSASKSEFLHKSISNATVRDKSIRSTEELEKKIDNIFDTRNKNFEAELEPREKNVEQEVKEAIVTDEKGEEIKDDDSKVTSQEPNQTSNIDIAKNVSYATANIETYARTACVAGKLVGACEDSAAAAKGFVAENSTIITVANTAAMAAMVGFEYATDGIYRAAATAVNYSVTTAKQWVLADNDNGYINCAADIGQSTLTTGIISGFNPVATGIAFGTSAVSCAAKDTVLEPAVNMVQNASMAVTGNGLIQGTETLKFAYNGYDFLYGLNNYFFGNEEHDEL